MNSGVAVCWLCSLLALPAAAGPLRLAPVEVGRALAVVGERFAVTTSLENTSGQDLEGLAVDLLLPPGWSAEPARIELPVLPAYVTCPVRFRLTASAPSDGTARLVVTGAGGGAALTAGFRLVSCPPLAGRMAIYRLTRPAVDELPEDNCLYVATGSYILFLPRLENGYGAGLVYLREGRQWTRVATIPAMGHVIYEDGLPDPQRSIPAERWVFGRRVYAPLEPARVDPDGWYLLTLRDEWRDRRGRQWIAKAYFAPTEDPRVIKCTHSLWCSGDARLYRFEGPMICVGDGTFGTERAAYRVADEPVEEGDDGPVLTRTGAVGEGVLAIERPGGGVFGLLWDPQQLWTSGKAQPHALFASPNVVYGQRNQLLTLLAPHYAPDQSPTASQARPGLVIPAGRPVYLRSELFISADGHIGDATAAYRQRFAGAPAL